MKKNLLFVAFVINAITCFSQASLVKNIGPGNQDGLNLVSELFPYGNGILFAGELNGRGVELLSSDGSDSGTILVKDINFNSYNSNPADFTLNTITNEVYFSASWGTSSGNTDWELWKTDGTAAGTSFVYDYNVSTWSLPREISENNGVIYSQVSTFGLGVEIGYSDGTTSGSGIIDVNPGTAGSHSYPENFTQYNGLVYFAATHFIYKREIYATDGTPSGTYIVKDINTANAGSDPDNFIVFNNKLYFTANNGINGRELWVTDGTAAGTQMVVDINPGSPGSNIQNLTVFGNKLYFSATTATNGNELYYITTTESLILYKDINPGSGSGNPSRFKVFNNKLYFQADSGSNGIELWRADGTIFGVGLFKDINTAGDSNPRLFTEYNGNLYFVADDGLTGEELWISDGTVSGTQLISDINLSGDSSPRKFVVAGDILFFHANDGVNGRELWKYQDPALNRNSFDINMIHIFPNPADSSFRIKSQDPIISVGVYNLLGKQVKQFNTSQELYDIAELSDGIYMLRVENSLGISTKKIIKQ